jgi:hypothetical protein
MANHSPRPSRPPPPGTFALTSDGAREVGEQKIFPSGFSDWYTSLPSPDCFGEVKPFERPTENMTFVTSNSKRLGVQ